jgi:hypothetical protein
MTASPINRMLPESLAEGHYTHQRPGQGDWSAIGKKGAAPVPVLRNERGPFLCLILSLTHRSSSVAMSLSRERDTLLTARKDTMRYDDDMRRGDPGRT